MRDESRDFVRLFVNTGWINQIVFKGRKRSSYYPEDAVRLAEFYKKNQPKKDFSIVLTERIILDELFEIMKRA